MANAFMINEKDSIATVTEAVGSGETVHVAMDGKVTDITALDPIPKYHKIAVCPVKKGDNVYKYGEVIGHATQDIRVGNHVHVQNLTDKE